MKKTVNKCISVLLACVMALTLLPGLAAFAEDAPAIVDSGYCGAEGDGTGARWTLDANGKLTVSGSGTVKDYAFSNNNSIKTLVIENGITGIGAWSFRFCSYLTSLSIADTVTSIGSNAFYRCLALPTLVIPGSVEKIGTYAFTDCRALRQVTIRPGVKEIGFHAFNACGVLEEAELPDTVETIGGGAFLGCGKLENVTVPANALVELDAFAGTPFYNAMPDGMVYLGATAYAYKGTMPADADIVIADGIKYIPDRLFEYQTALRSVTLPDSVISVGASAFRNCDNLISVQLPSSLTSIGGGAFYECVRLSEIDVPDSVTEIGGSAFYGCSMLTSIHLPSSLTAINGNLFQNCTGLTEIVIPDSVTSISIYGVFDGCASLQRIVIGSGVTGSLKNFLSGDVPNLTELTVSPDNPVYHSAGNCVIETATGSLVAIGKNSVIPTDGSVKKIDAGAFSNLSWLTEIVIPDSVTEIGTSAFSGCENLTTVTLPAALPVIRPCTFRNCTSLTDINIPETVKEIGYECFLGCKALPSITIPEGVTVIGRNAFQSCSSLTGISIPDSVTTLGTYAFTYCTALAELTIGSGVKTITQHSFEECKALTSVEIPDTVTQINIDAFKNCTSLTSVSIGKGLKTLNSLAFYKTVALSEITVSPENAKFMSSGNCIIEKASKKLVIGCKTSVIPTDGSVTAIGDHAFDGCSTLTHITIPEGVKSIGVESFYDSGLTEIALPDSLISVGDSAFYRCEDMRTVTFGSGITTIGAQGFYWSGVEEITLPDQITSLGEKAFYECHQLASVHIGAGITDIPYSVFFGTRSLRTLTVSEDNPTYYAEGGCLITKADKKLVHNCPCEDIVIPHGVEIIGKLYIYNCYESFTDTLTIPNSVVRFDSNVFASSNVLKKVYFIGSTAQWNAIENKPDFKKAVICTTGGTCGENVNWSYADGVLTLTGTGATYDYTSSYKPEWICYKDEIAAVVVEEGITALGSNVFLGLPALSSVSLPNGLLIVGDHAFANCGALTQITLPESVAELREYAFSNAGLTHFEVPAGLTVFGERVFSGCASLACVTFPEDITRISDYAFYGCSALTDVTLPAGLTEIGNNAFYSCSALTGIALPAGLTGIGNNAFAYCRELTNISLPDTLTLLGNRAFTYCVKLGTVSLPNSLTSIGEGLFAHCTGLTGVTFPENISELPDNMFYGCTLLSDVTVPQTLTAIGNHAFAYCQALTSVSLPDGITEIPYSVFYGCWMLSDLRLPQNLTSIGDYAFGSCRELTSLELPESVSAIGYAAFANCTKLENLTLPSSLTSVSVNLFSGCGALMDVTVPVGVTEIGRCAFYNCRQIKNVFYGGTGEQWAQITADTGNDCLLNAAIHYESTGHTPGEPVYENETPATCTEPGSHEEVVYCVYCDYEFSRRTVTTDPLGHVYLWYEAVPATCTEDGHTAYRYCSRCGIYDPVPPETISALGHSWGDPVRENEIPAGCTTTGEYDLVTYCTVCGDVVSSEHVFEPALGHSFTSAITTAPTCTEPGVRTYTCERCNDTYTEEEPALGHGTLDYDVSSVPSTCSVRGYSMTVCIACGEITDYQEFPLDPTFHNWSRWAVVTPATYLTEGLEQRTCCWCGGAETRPIPVLVPQQKIEDPDTGIELQMQNGVLPENTVFEVDEEFDGTYFRLLNRDVENVGSTLYNITPVADGVNVQPDGYVLVRLPIPEGYNPDMLCVYYISTETGVTERIDCYIEDGYVCFQTNHFSVYAIVDASSPAEAPTENPTDDGGASLSFFARIAAFFRSIADFFKTLFHK